MITNTVKFSLACTACDWSGPEADINNCPVCGGTIEPVYTSPEIPVDPTQPGIWRYGAHLPLDPVDHVVSLGEGSTPLLRSAQLADELGLPGLHFKLEGSNPTGSYKDRTATVGLSRLRALGKTAWAATSSGNAGASMAAYGARTGVDGYLFTLEKASLAKIAQILSYGPRTMAVDRLGYDPAVEAETWANIRQVCDEKNWMMLVTAHAFSPHAMEGVKTLAYETCEQLGNEPPDVVYVPVGGGGLLRAGWRGFKEWQAAGYIDRLPRLVAVQACGCDAVAAAWREERAMASIPDCTSTISGLQLTAPPDGDLALAAVRESNGWATSVADAETYRAQADLATREGIFAEPAAAITLAAVRADLASGRLDRSARVVCWLTGVGFKDATAVQRMAEAHTVERIRAEDILSKL